MMHSVASVAYRRCTCLFRFQPVFSLSSRLQHTSPSHSLTQPIRVKPISEHDVQHHKEIFPAPDQSKPDAIAQRKSFHHQHPYALHTSVVKALAATEKYEPTHIQQRSIQTLLAPSKSHVIIASETGSGKTLSYLIPLMSKLKTNEVVAGGVNKADSILDNDDDFIIGSKMMSPSVLIIQPTRELSEQAYRVAKDLSHVAKLRVRLITNTSTLKQKNSLMTKINQSPFDILIGTPGSINKLISSKQLYLAHVQAVVMDEADELLESQLLITNTSTKRQLITKRNQTERFDLQLLPLMKQMKSLDHFVQHIYSVATISTHLEQSIRKWHDDEVHSDGKTVECTMLRGERLHRVENNRHKIKTTFIRIDPSDQGTDEAKICKLIEVLSAATKRADCGKVMIFCDDFNRREYMVKCLNKNSVISSYSRGGSEDFDGVVHLGANDERDEDGVMDSPEKRRGARARTWKAFREGKVKVGVCAKSFGRGIDDTDIKTVFLMDVPYTGSEYLHRVGRIRNTGRVYVILGRKEEVRAESLFISCVRGERLAGMTSKSSWEERLDSPKDRIESDSFIRRARKDSAARWVDERSSKLGSFRGRQGRGENKVEQETFMLPPKEQYRGVVQGKMKWPPKKKRKRY